MPYASKKRCAHYGCSELTASTYCRKHTQAKPRGRDTRSNAQDRGYDAEWQRVRKAALKACGFTCNRCGVRAVVVHHIREISGKDDPMRLEPSNLECLCRGCHERHHGRAR